MLTTGLSGKETLPSGTIALSSLIEITRNLDSSFDVSTFTRVDIPNDENEHALLEKQKVL